MRKAASTGTLKKLGEGKCGDLSSINRYQPYHMRRSGSSGGLSTAGRHKKVAASPAFYISLSLCRHISSSWEDESDKILRYCGKASACHQISRLCALPWAVGLPTLVARRQLCDTVLKGTRSVCISRHRHSLFTSFEVLKVSISGAVLVFEGHLESFMSKRATGVWLPCKLCTAALAYVHTKCSCSTALTSGRQKG